jgi:hypothetical protein
MKMREKNFGFELQQREHVSLDELRDTFFIETTAPFPSRSLATSMKFCQTIDD